MPQLNMKINLIREITTLGSIHVPYRWIPDVLPCFEQANLQGNQSKVDDDSKIVADSLKHT